MMERYQSSGSTASGYGEPMTKEAFEAAAHGAGCEKVAGDTPTVYQTTTITFGPDSTFKQYMYDNICPVAAAQLKDCYRCPSADGTRCVEYQAFHSQKEFEAYKRYGWVPPAMMERYKSSGSTASGYGESMTKEAFEAAAHAAGCEKV